MRTLHILKWKDRRERLPDSLPCHPGRHEQNASMTNIAGKRIVVAVIAASEVVLTPYDHDRGERGQEQRIQPTVKKQRSIWLVHHAKPALRDQLAHVARKVAAVAEEQRGGLAGRAGERPGSGHPLRLLGEQLLRHVARRSNADTAQISNDAADKIVIMLLRHMFEQQLIGDLAIELLHETYSSRSEA